MLKHIAKVVSMVAVMVICVAVVAACGASTPESAVRVHYMEADYPIYRTVRSLVASSDVVVLGTVVKVLPAQRVIPADVPLDRLPQEKADAVGFLITDVVIQVDQVLAGATNLLNTQLRVAHLGGEQGNHRFVAENEPLSQPGSSYLFFLKTMEGGRFATVGGAQGRYLAQDAILSPISEEVVGLPVVKELNHLKLSELSTLVSTMVVASGEVDTAALDVTEVDEPLNPAPDASVTGKLPETPTEPNGLYFPYIEN